ncbi:hypothetical protein RI367_007037 [Sorochytrium milnesiophthora]
MAISAVAWLILLTALAGTSVQQDASTTTIANVSSQAHTPPRRWAVRLPVDSPEYASRVAQRDGFINRGRIGALAGHFLFEAAEDVPPATSLDYGLSSAQQLKHAPRSNDQVEHLFSRNENGDYEWFAFQVRRERVRRQRRRPRLAVNTTHPPPPSFLIGDNFNAATGFDDPLWPLQWPVHRTDGNTFDVINVWRRDLTGQGMHIAVIDDGIDYTHPDLADSYVAETSYNFIDVTPDAAPRSALDNHGTRCAGQIVAKPNNSVCNVGIAFDAKVSAIKLIGDLAPSDADEANAFNHYLDRHHVYSSSWGPKDDGSSMEAPGVLAMAAMRKGVETGRGGLGAVYVVASGNGGRGDNCNFDGYANNVLAISVGSAMPDESLPRYSELCAAHLVTAYSGDEAHGIVTTDLGHGCTERHTGTSAATPFVSGMIALALQARPDLSWRDVQHLVVHSTMINDMPGPDYDWVTNNAGLRVSYRFAFGVLNADMLVRNALNWRKVPYLVQEYKSDTMWPHLAIPLGEQPISSTVQVTFEQAGLVHLLEHVQVRLTIRHNSRGVLTVRLLGPTGRETGGIRTESLLASERTRDDTAHGFQDWTFMTVRHWDESPVGNWTLVVTDSRPEASTGTAPPPVRGLLESWQLILRGRCSYSFTTTTADDRVVCVADPSTLSKMLNIQWGRVIGGLTGIGVLLAAIVYAHRWWAANAADHPLTAKAVAWLKRFSPRRLQSRVRKAARHKSMMPRSLSLQLLTSAEEGSSPVSSPLKSALPKSPYEPVSPFARSVRLPLQQLSPGADKKQDLDSPTSPQSPYSDSETSRPTSPTSPKPLAKARSISSLSVRTANSSRAANNDPSATPLVPVAPSSRLRDPDTLLSPEWAAAMNTSGGPRRDADSPTRLQRARSSDMLGLSDRTAGVRLSPQPAVPPPPSTSAQHTRSTLRSSPSSGILRMFAGKSDDPQKQD